MSRLLLKASELMDSGIIGSSAGSKISLEEFNYMWDNLKGEKFSTHWEAIIRYLGLPPVGKKYMSKEEMHELISSVNGLDERPVSRVYVVDSPGCKKCENIVLKLDEIVRMDINPAIHLTNDSKVDFIEECLQYWRWQEDSRMLDVGVVGSLRGSRGLGVDPVKFSRQLERLVLDLTEDLDTIFDKVARTMIDLAREFREEMEMY